MHVSAHPRRLDYAVRPLHSKNNRRSDDDESGLITPVDEADEQPGRRSAAPPTELAFEDDDESVEYSRNVLSRVETVGRRDMVSESVRPAPTLNATALMALMATAKAEAPTGAVVPAAPKMTAKTAPKKPDAFYDLLDQVIAQA